MMSDRENSPAWRMLPRRARRVFAAIGRAIGDRSSASVSYVDFRLDRGISRKKPLRDKIRQPPDNLSRQDHCPNNSFIKSLWLC
jgi:hypothetical protein